MHLVGLNIGQLHDGQSKGEVIIHVGQVHVQIGPPFSHMCHCNDTCIVICGYMYIKGTGDGTNPVVTLEAFVASIVQHACR